MAIFKSALSAARSLFDDLQRRQLKKEEAASRRLSSIGKFISSKVAPVRRAFETAKYLRFPTAEERTQNLQQFLGKHPRYEQLLYGAIKSVPATLGMAAMTPFLPSKTRERMRTNLQAIRKIRESRPLRETLPMDIVFNAPFYAQFGKWLEAPAATSLGKYLPQGTRLASRVARGLGRAAIGELASSALVYGPAEAILQKKPYFKTTAEETATGLIGAGVGSAIGKTLGVGALLAGGIKSSVDAKNFLKRFGHLEDIANSLSMVMSAKGTYDKMSPRAQIKMFEWAQELAEGPLKDIANTREMKRLSILKPGEWLNVIAKFANDRFAKARSPEPFVGFGIRKLEAKPTKIKAPKITKADDFISQLERAKRLKGGKLPEIDTTESARRYAETASYGGQGRGPRATILPDIKAQFENWVNKRNAAKIADFAKRKEFAYLDEGGIDGIFAVQAGKNKGKYKELRRFFDNAYEKIKKIDKQINYQKNYIPQLWQEPEEKVAEVLGRTFTMKPGFTFEKVIDSYKEGIEKGLTPRFTTISELAGWYQGRVNKTLADREFFNYLIKEKLIQPSPQTKGLGWVTLDPDRFPTRKVKIGKETYVGTFSAPKPLADLINNYLKNPDGPIEQLANYASRVKNIALSAGVPKTAINFHGFNILARNVMASKNPVEGFLTGVKYMIKPDIAEKDLIKNLPLAEFAVKNGLTISTEGHSIVEMERGQLKKLLGKAGELRKDWMEKPLFQQMIPALKLKHFKEVFDDLVSSGVNKKEAGKMAAKITNSIYGGINIDALGRDKNLQSLLRAGLLAPDWAETQVRTAGGILRSIANPKTPEYKAYRTILRNLAMMYLGATFANKIFTGRWLHQNPAGREFEVAVGKDSKGQTIFVRPFGTAADFVRLPYEIVSALVKGDFSAIPRIIRNRLSIPLGVVVGLLANVDYRGKPILGQDVYGRPMTVSQQAVNLAQQAGRLVGVPPQLQAVSGLITGQDSPEETLAKMAEAPLRFQDIDLNEVYKIKRQSQKEQAKRKQQASRLYNQLSKIDPVEANKRAGEIKSTDPLLYRELEKIVKEKKAGLSRKESTIKSLPVYDGTRAKAIAAELKKLKTREEKNALVKKWINAKIITDTVYKQLSEMRKRGEL